MVSSIADNGPLTPERKREIVAGVTGRIRMGFFMAVCPVCGEVTPTNVAIAEHRRYNMVFPCPRCKFHVNWRDGKREWIYRAR